MYAGYAHRFKVVDSPSQLPLFPAPFLAFIHFHENLGFEDEVIIMILCLLSS